MAETNIHHGDTETLRKNKVRGNTRAHGGGGGHGGIGLPSPSELAASVRKSVTARKISTAGNTIRVLCCELAGAAEDIGQHLFGEFAGGGVLLAGVVGTHQDRLPCPDAVLEIVAELEGSAAGDRAAGFQDVQVIVEGNFAERDHHFEVGQ